MRLSEWGSATCLYKLILGCFSLCGLTLETTCVCFLCVFRQRVFRQCVFRLVTPMLKYLEGTKQWAKEWFLDC